MAGKDGVTILPELENAQKTDANDSEPSPIATVNNAPQRSASKFVQRGKSSGSAHPRHKVTVPEGGPRHTGVVLSRQDTFGFLKSVDNEARLFFHVRDTDGFATQGAQVTFVVARDETSGKEMNLYGLKI